MWVAAAPPALAQDRVYPKQGAVASGKILNLSPAAVTIEVRGKNQNFEMSDVRKITFDDEPNSLDRARENVLSGQFDQALDELKKIEVAAISAPLVQQDVQFYRYYCEGKLGLASGGDKAAAIQGLLALASANRETHHLYNLGELLGELAMAIGQPDKAGNYFRIMLSAADPEIKALGMYRLADVDLQTGKTAEAKKSFETLAGISSQSPAMARLKSLAAVGLALCENAAGDSAGAIKRLEDLVAKNDSTDQQLFSRIFNALGTCYMKLDKPTEAVLSYLKTDLLYFTEAEPHAEALYHLKQLFPKVGNAAKGAEAGARLVASYPSSTWANKP